MKNEWRKARATYPDLLEALAGPWEKLQEVAARSEPAPKDEQGWIGCLVLAAIVFFVVKGCT